MTLEEIRQLKVGDYVWMLCRDEEPGTAVKCEVTKAVNDYDVITIKCVDNPKCKGHRPWYGDVYKTKIETYEKVIEKTQDSIDRSEGIIESEKKQIEEKKADLKTLKERLDKAKEEDLVWITNCGEVQQVFAHDHVFRNFIHYATQEEAYDALADYYRHKFIEASVKGTGGWLAIAKEHIVFLPQTWSLASPKARFDRMGADMNGQVWRFNKSDLFRFRKEAADSLKEKEGEAYAKAERRQV